VGVGHKARVGAGGPPDDEGQGGRTTNNLGVASVRPPSGGLEALGRSAKSTNPPSISLPAAAHPLRVLRANSSIFEETGK